ncbi:MAG TPA: GT4 family glycosyltransferase PelF [Candidatus Binatia bacterium]|nr:GT4 family glycosyltransferase PelF [Candidatus Binatia bacterium]
MRTDPPYRLAYVIGELGKGGAEYQLHELLRLLDPRFFEARVFALATGGYWGERIRQLGVPVEELPRRGSADVGRLRRLRSLLREFAPHILHTVLWSANSYGRLAARGLGIPVVIAGERNAIRRPAWQVLVERVLDRTTDAYLVNCEAIAALLADRERVAPAKIRVIPNGVDLARLPPFALERTRATPGRRVVAQVGRLSAQKDHPTFLRAAALVAAELPDVDFLIVGEGEERKELEALAARLRVADRLHFTGLVHDVPALLRGVDALALTSTYEGFPNVVVEAMATGAVAVATDVGGCRELITPQETGLLVPPRAPAAVAAALLRVLRDPALARRLALAARRHVETHLAVERMAERTAGAYLELLRAHRIPAAVAAA